MDKKQPGEPVVVTDFDMSLASIIRLSLKVAVAQVIVAVVASMAGLLGFFVLAVLGAGLSGGR
jgi:hypothetical protein